MTYLVESPENADVRALDSAMDGLGADGVALIEFLVGRPQARVRAAKEKWEGKHDNDRTRGRRCERGVLTQPIRHRRDNSHTGPGGQFVVPLPAPAPPRGPLYPYMAPGHGG